MRADRLDKALGPDVGAQVMDLESGPLQHGNDEILSDVVEIALDGAGDDDSGGLRAGRGQQGLQRLHCRFHRAAGQQELRHEVLLLLEEPAHFVHRRNHRLGNERQRCGPRLEFFLDDLLRERRLAVHDCVEQLRRTRHFLLPVHVNPVRLGLEIGT